MGACECVVVAQIPFSELFDSDRRMLQRQACWFPPEIWNEVLLWVPWFHIRGTLKSLSLTSRLTYLVARPLLFRKLSINVIRKEQHIESFIFFLKANVHVALCVRVLTLTMLGRNGNGMYGNEGDTDMGEGDEDKEDAFNLALLQDVLGALPGLRELTLSHLTYRYGRTPLFFKNHHFNLDRLTIFNHPSLVARRRHCPCAIAVHILSVFARIGKLDFCNFHECSCSLGEESAEENAQLAFRRHAATANISHLAVETLDAYRLIGFALFYIMKILEFSPSRKALKAVDVCIRNQRSVHAATPLLRQFGPRLTSINIHLSQYTSTLRNCA